jgi:hypothetical protein
MRAGVLSVLSIDRPAARPFAGIKAWISCRPLHLAPHPFSAPPVTASFLTPLPLSPLHELTAAARASVSSRISSAHKRRGMGAPGAMRGGAWWIRGDLPSLRSHRPKVRCVMPAHARHYAINHSLDKPQSSTNHARRRWLPSARLPGTGRRQRPRGRWGRWRGVWCRGQGRHRRWQCGCLHGRLCRHNRRLEGWYELSLA